jgi:hypothetical protein
MVNGVGLVSIRDILLNANPVSLVVYASAVLFSVYIFFLGVLKNVRIRNFMTIYLFFIPLVILTFSSFLFDIFSPRALILISPLFYFFVSWGSTFPGKGKFVQKAIVLLMLIIIFQQIILPGLKVPQYKKYLIYNKQQLINLNGESSLQ